jgi:trk system potassium uptake protein TrkA
MVWQEDEGAMRVVFIGAGKVSTGTARELLKRAMKSLSLISIKPGSMTCLKRWIAAFCGRWQPANVLREVNPAQTDFLFCLTDSDQVNVIASLVGRSLGFKRVVTSIGDQQFEGICHELGLSDTIIPSITISRYLEEWWRAEKELNFLQSSRTRQDFLRDCKG